MILNKKGQAIFEFILFVPVMVILYSITISIISAINGSINQQKITRGYFFNLIHNDSNYPTANVIRDYNGKKMGMFAMGWRSGAVGETPIAPCYRVFSLYRSKVAANGKSANNNPPPAANENEATEATLESCSSIDPGAKSMYIRVKTVFGVCTETYLRSDTGFVRAINYGIPVSDFSSCLITD